MSFPLFPKHITFSSTNANIRSICYRLIFMHVSIKTNVKYCRGTRVLLWGTEWALSFITDCLCMCQRARNASCLSSSVLCLWVSYERWHTQSIQMSKPLAGFMEEGRTGDIWSLTALISALYTRWHTAAPNGTINTHAADDLSGVQDTIIL